MRNRLIRLGFAAGAVGLLALVLVPASAFAVPQSKAQQGCVNMLNKGGAKVAATQGKAGAGCIKNAGKGKLVGTAEACLTADPKNKLGKAKDKNVAGEGKKCTCPDKCETPGFGATSAANGNTVAVDEELRLLHDIYGPDLDAAILTTKVEAKCQASIVKAYEKLAATKIKQFLGCKKSALSGKVQPQAASAADLEGCLSGRPDSISADPKGKILKMRDKLTDTIVKKCPGVDTDAAFPGDCVGAGDFATCVDERVECHVCLMINAMDGLNADCDLFDDGVANCSCTPPPQGNCGNGVIDSGETCDPGCGSPRPDCTDVGRLGTSLAVCGPSCTCECPTRVEWEGDGNLADLDTGWTGQAHDQKVVNNGIVTFGINCTPSSRPCGQCDVTGAVENDNSVPSPLSGGLKANNHRCLVDTSIECSADSDCPSQTCEFYYGSYLPLSAGGVATCVENQVEGAVSGTVNVESCDGNVIFKLSSRVYNGILVAQPCPTCDGDVAPFDGVRDGTCNGGIRNGLTCDVGGIHPFINSFGSTSFDCPPLPGAKIADLTIDLTSVTGSITKNISATSPSCTAAGWGSFKCLSDTCANASAQACWTDADCTLGGTCGGKRCINSGNDGTPCNVNTDCSGVGANCGRPGQATQVNSCNGGASDCVAGTPFDEGTCAGGKFDQFCGIEPFRGCLADSDCPVSGDTCAGGKLRECYTTDGLVAGDTDVWAIGAPGTPVNDICSPIAASLFAIGPTTAPAVNSVVGLPGPGRLTLPGNAGGLP